jgi:hypothetical protein
MNLSSGDTRRLEFAWVLSDQCFPTSLRFAAEAASRGKKAATPEFSAVLILRSSTRFDWNALNLQERSLKPLTVSIVNITGDKTGYLKRTILVKTRIYFKAGNTR